MTVAGRLARIWYSPQRTFVATLLLPLSWLFGAAAAVRRTAYRAGILRRTRIPVPVVVVGNITAGGSGKTPLVLALAEALRARGRNPGLVSRGYGRRTHDVREVAPAGDARAVGDEALLLAASGAPTWVGGDRPAAAQALLAAHPEVDVIVADDGLQHYALARDVEIAVLDATRGLGNGALLPAGPLREPAARLGAVDAIVRLEADGAPPLRRYGAREFAMTHDAQAFVNLCDPARPFDPALLFDPSSVAIAGIAHPERFFDALRARGFRGGTLAFPDHHPFAPRDVAFGGARAILMTEKDGVKCRAFADARMWMLPIRARIDPALVDFVLGRIDGSQAPRNARLPGDEGAAHP